MATIPLNYRVSTNIVLIVVWGILSFVSARDALPHAWEVFVAAIVIGVAGGIMQWKGFNEAKSDFLGGKTLLDVRATLKYTEWGCLYSCFLWGVTILMAILLGLGFGGGDYRLNFFMFFFTRAFVRDLITLPMTFQLRKLLNRSRRPG